MLTLPDLALAHRTFGTGPVPLFAFHGFGRTGQDFAVFDAALGERFTIHAFDLPFHGRSASPALRADIPFTPQELRDHFIRHLERTGSEQAVLLGFSLGGRVALSLLGMMPHRISHVVLIAPDGLKERPWYRALAASAWGRARYRSFIERPGRVHGLVHAMRRSRLLRDKMHRFIIGQTDSREKRQLLHDVWLSYRALEPDLVAIAKNLREHSIPLDLIFGTFDSVIPPKLGHRFAKLAPDMIHVYEEPLGHQLLTPGVAGRVAELLATGARRT